MRRRLLLGIVFSIALAACAGPSSSPSSLIGTWTPLSAEFDGDAMPVASFHGAVLRLTADTYAFGDDTGVYALIATQTPSAMNILGVAGPNAGRTIFAIHRRDDDVLTICYQLGPGPRPYAFTTTKGSRQLMVHYRRTD